MTQYKIAVIVLSFVLVLMPIIAQDEDESTRSFYMGFTPFPYEISLDAIQDVYAHIADDADMIVHHFDNGVPWQEALDGSPYSDNIMDDWTLRRTLTPPDHQILVSLTPISIGRDALAPYRGEQDDMPLPAPWDSYSFDHPDVIQAFINHAEANIAYFQPDYLLIGIEVNLLMSLRPDLWDAYVTLHREAYTAIKAAHPELPVMVSMTGADLLEGYTDVDHADQMRALADIIDTTDVLALSIYPFITAFLTNSIPTEIFDQLAELTDKPLAIAETGYPAQPFRIEIGADIQFNGTPELQEEWITLVLESAQAYEYQFVTNFILQDYDSLWEAVGGQADLTILWRDTGLYDENGNARPALAVWQEWLMRDVATP